MSANDHQKKKCKNPKQNTSSLTNPGPSNHRSPISDDEVKPSLPLCPLLAKDSEWVGIQATDVVSRHQKSASSASGEEGVQQELEEGPETKPLAIMFPGLLENPQTLNGMLNKAMSTTEVTKRLVNLGQKANFTRMKQANKLIPQDKIWLESVRENNNSCTMIGSEPYSGFSGTSSCHRACDNIEEAINIKEENKRRFTTKDTKNTVLQKDRKNDGEEINN